MERLLAVRYPPFAGTDKLKQFNKMGMQKPNFDRAGNTKVGLIWYVLTLGSGNATGAVLRAVVLAAICFGLRAGMNGRAKL
jgi:hypothetical protein